MSSASSTHFRSRLATQLGRVSAALRWLGTFRSQVQREADLLIRSHGVLADRYARDHVRLARERRRKRDLALYTAVSEEIAARAMIAPSTGKIVECRKRARPIALAAGVAWLPDWLPALNGALAMVG